MRCVVVLVLLCVGCSFVSSKAPTDELSLLQLGGEKNAQTVAKNAGNIAANSAKIDKLMGGEGKATDSAQQQASTTESAAAAGSEANGADVAANSGNIEANSAKLDKLEAKAAEEDAAKDGTNAGNIAAKAAQNDEGSAAREPAGDDKAALQQASTALDEKLEQQQEQETDAQKRLDKTEAKAGAEAEAKPGDTTLDARAVDSTEAAIKGMLEGARSPAEQLKHITDEQITSLAKRCKELTEGVTAETDNSWMNEGTESDMLGEGAQEGYTETSALITNCSALADTMHLMKINDVYSSNVRRLEIQLKEIQGGDEDEKSCE